MELKLDFNTPTMGPVEISYVGDMPSVKILDHNEHMQEVTAKGEPKKIILLGYLLNEYKPQKANI